VSALVPAAVLLAGFAAAERLSRRRGGGRRRWPLLAYAAVLAAAGFELSRWDHGQPGWLLPLGFVGAPVIVIFGAAAEGARRWYGWPDFGPVPGRLALAAAALLAGVVAGQRVKDDDVEATMARGRAVARDLRAWSAANAGRWPATLEEAVPDAPRTRLGWLSPPPFAFDPATRRLSFPVRSGAPLVLAADDPSAAWKAP
jgi:hypothetical protein